MSEWAKIAQLREILGDAKVPVGIGDDAAVLGAPGNVVTVDAQVEHVHFECAWLSMRDLGYRAVMAAASDLVAMRAQPCALVCAITLPAGFADTSLEQLALGQREAADELGAPVVGGNLSRGRDLSLTTTAIGTTQRPLLRSGAHIGDVVQVTGALGLSAAGLRALQRGSCTGLHVETWRRPRAQMHALGALGPATAGIDISDGLVQDLAHLAHASGLGIALQNIPITESLREACTLLGADPLELALYGGEDYALVACSPETLTGFVPIGICVAERGVCLNQKPLDTAKGYDHFR